MHAQDNVLHGEQSSYQQHLLQVPITRSLRCSSPSAAPDISLSRSWAWTVPTLARSLRAFSQFNLLLWFSGEKVRITGGMNLLIWHGAARRRGFAPLPHLAGSRALAVVSARRALRSLHTSLGLFGTLTPAAGGLFGTGRASGEVPEEVWRSGASPSINHSKRAGLSKAG